MQTTTTTATTMQADTGIKERPERSEPLRVPLGDLLQAAMLKKADGRGGVTS